MDIPIQERVSFLQASHLFHELAEDELPKIGESLSVVTRADKELIFKAGEQADAFYMIYSGKVRISRLENGVEQQLGILVRGDYFGEGVIRPERAVRNATARAAGTVILLTMSRTAIHELMRNSPRFHRNIMVSVSSRRLAHRKRFKWVRDDETVHFVVRKHVIILLGKLALPAMVGIVGFILLLLGISSGGTVFLGASGSVFLLAFLWGLWNWLDWSNDYYIITNQRVVWLEKVIATYDSSVDSPLSAIRNENVETSMIGRILDYGDLIVFTFIGKIIFRNIPHPYEARAFVQEQRGRIKEVTKAEESQKMKSAIRERIFSDGKPSAPLIKFSPLRAEPVQARKTGGILSLRFEDKDTITYRKHIFVLFTKAGLPTLLSIGMLAILGLLIGSWLKPGSEAFSRFGLFLVWLVVFFIFLVWAAYQYLDWSNDIFQVSATQIYDIDKKPLGDEHRRSAQLENILSMESKRIGILQLLFNYGSVHINITGQESMVFEDVLNPSAVQQDIERRRLAGITKKETEKSNAERERMADAIADFYHEFEELKKEERERKQRSGVQ